MIENLQNQYQETTVNKGRDLLGRWWVIESEQILIKQELVAYDQ
jgi:hypothetical protein